jgi:transcriptional regulator with XRE-family HTH domain
VEIGDRIRSERDRLGCTQPEFAALAGATKRSQIAWEKGDALPNAGALAAWAARGADVQYIIAGKRGLVNVYNSCVGKIGPEDDQARIVFLEVEKLIEYTDDPDDASVLQKKLFYVDDSEGGKGNTTIHGGVRTAGRDFIQGSTISKRKGK